MLKKCLAAILSMSALLSGCGTGKDSFPGLPESATSCTTGTAAIGIQDGQAGVLCGCSEASSWRPVPVSVTCTVSAGTTVRFIYVGTTLWHQIVPDGTPSFPPSTPSNPSDQHPFLVDTVPFPTAGTYKFTDNYNHAISGRIVVQ